MLPIYVTFIMGHPKLGQIHGRLEVIFLLLKRVTFSTEGVRIIPSHIGMHYALDTVDIVVFGIVQDLSLRVFCRERELLCTSVFLIHPT